MTRANNYHLIRLLCAFILLITPASSQELRRGSAPPPTIPNSQATDAQEEKVAEQRLWDSIRESANPQDYKTFLTKYPRGQFIDEARSRLSALLGQEYVTLFMKRLVVNSRWSSVEQQLVRRANLIPGLVASLQTAGVQEQELYWQIAEARAVLLSAMHTAPQAGDDHKTPEQKQSVIDAANSFERAFRRFDALAENYPQLSSYENLRSKTDELLGAANRLFVARADYNQSVVEYNTARTEPRMAAAAENHGFTEEPFFKPEHERPVAPQIKITPPSPVGVSKPRGA